VKEAPVKTTIAVVLVLVLLPLACAEPAFAGGKEAKQVELARRAKEGLTKLGTGPEARVKLTLRDKTKLEGYVSQVTDTHVVVTDAAGTATMVPFPDVAQVHGNNLRTRWKVVIAAAIVTGIIITLYIVRGAFCDGC
jgi:hypothetical protein